MSSLAAARADNFYNPPDWDPSQISRDKYQNSKGSNQYEQRGEIRFEMPWNIWCTSCDSHIGRGVRYNAKKVHIGHYFSTKLWEFTMKCHLCKAIIKICTDPQNCDYKITAGGKRQCTTYSADDLEIIDIQNEAHKEKMETDPIYRLQHEELDKRNKLQNALRLQSLYELQEREKNDYDNNCALRKRFRQQKKKRLKLVQQADAKGLAIELLEISKEDEEKTKSIAFRAHANVAIDVDVGCDDNQNANKRHRLKLENESIFNRKRKLSEMEGGRDDDGEGEEENGKDDECNDGKCEYDEKSERKRKTEKVSRSKRRRKKRKVVRREEEEKEELQVLSLHSRSRHRSPAKGHNKSLLNKKKKMKEEKKLLLLSRMKQANKAKNSCRFSFDTKNVTFSM